MLDGQCMIDYYMRTIHIASQELYKGN